MRRVRFASRGLVASPQKVLTDGRWTDALTRVVDRGRALHKEVALHAHFNHPREVTAVTRRATGLLMERGVFVRSQAVLQRGVNDDPAVMTALVKRLGYANAHAYYVYVHDLVRGVEDLRTSLAAALRVEKHVRGATAGFNTPVFVVDAPGGGGERERMIGDAVARAHDAPR
jgi:lysine 2,3-aminomutase